MVDAKDKLTKMSPMEKQEMAKKAKADRKSMAKSSIVKEAPNSTELEDKTDDAQQIENLLLVASDQWKEELRQTSLAWKELKRTANDFDLKDPYWADLFLKKALDELDGVVPDDDVEVPYTPDRSLTLAPTMGPQVLGISLEEPLDPKTLLLPQTPQKSHRDLFLGTRANATPVKRLNEVTDDGAGMYNNLATFLDERKLWNAELKAADFNGDNKPVNTAAVLIEPNEKMLEDLAQVDKALDNQKLQREDLAKAKKTFHIDENADKFNVSGMKISKAPTDWQLLAANAMYDTYKDPKLTGMLIADDVGLGKTWVTMTFLLKVRPRGRYPQGFFSMLIFSRFSRR